MMETMRGSRGTGTWWCTGWADRRRSGSECPGWRGTTRSGRTTRRAHSQLLWLGVSATVHVAATLSLGAAARVTATLGVSAAVGVVGGVGVLQRRQRGQRVGRAKHLLQRREGLGGDERLRGDRLHRVESVVEQLARGPAWRPQTPPHSPGRREPAAAPLAPPAGRPAASEGAPAALPREGVAPHGVGPIRVDLDGKGDARGGEGAVVRANVHEETGDRRDLRQRGGELSDAEVELAHLFAEDVAEEDRSEDERQCADRSVPEPGGALPGAHTERLAELEQRLDPEVEQVAQEEEGGHRVVYRARRVVGKCGDAVAAESRRQREEERGAVQRLAASREAAGDDHVADDGDGDGRGERDREEEGAKVGRGLKVERRRYEVPFWPAVLLGVRGEDAVRDGVGDGKGEERQHDGAAE
mmetsp:Transcript_8862/g.26546  ORF Transcript_8862/g.26546 Transcript_8862/m.26546 type:complete len:414 (+) Transcript_8862:108-1349(+)